MSFEVRKYYEPNAWSGAGKGAAAGATIGSVIPGWGTAIGAAAGAIIGGITGWIQKRKAKRALEAAKFNAVPEDVLETQKMARQLANEGLPAAQYKQAEQNIQRNQNAALAYAQDRRSGLMKVGQVQQATNDANLGLDVASGQQRVQNIKYLGQVNSIVGQYKQKRGERDWSYAMELMGAANQNLSNAADQGASAIGYGYNEADRLGLFNRRGGGGSSIRPGIQSVTGSGINHNNMNPVIGGGKIKGWGG